MIEGQPLNDLRFKALGVKDLLCQPACAALFLVLASARPDVTPLNRNVILRLN
jgi:hypothetical protein